jgi:hypothetical protein
LLPIHIRKVLRVYLKHVSSTTARYHARVSRSIQAFDISYFSTLILSNCKRSFQVSQSSTMSAPRSSFFTSGQKIEHRSSYIMMNHSYVQYIPPATKDTPSTAAASQAPSGKTRPTYDLRGPAWHPSLATPSTSSTPRTQAAAAAHPTISARLPIPDHQPACFSPSTQKRRCGGGSGGLRAKSGPGSGLDPTRKRLFRRSNRSPGRNSKRWGIMSSARSGLRVW